MIHLTESNLDTIFNARGIVIVDCWAPWCGPCKAYGSVFEKVAKMIENERIAFVKWNIDDKFSILNPELYNIRSIPTTLILGDQGRLVDSKVGIMTEEQLLNFVIGEVKIAPFIDQESNYNIEENK